MLFLSYLEMIDAISTWTDPWMDTAKEELMCQNLKIGNSALTWAIWLDPHMFVSWSVN